jgi:hypothetical protein
LPPVPPLPPAPPAPPTPVDDTAVDDELEGSGQSIIGFWQTHASLTQHPSWKHGKHSSVQMNSSQVPGVGLHIMPLADDDAMDAVVGPDVDDDAELELDDDDVPELEVVV